MSFHVGFGHPEWEDMHGERFLAIGQGGVRQGVDFFHAIIGHGKAADGRTTTVYHQGLAGPAEGLVIFIGIPQVKGKMELTPWIELGYADVIETFGALFVSLSFLGSEIP